ncbi:MAG: DinB family protein [Chloroflexi bacterium]|nr:DinB family protein [Chloroflexota bacterium]MDA1146995.1 DinB family protein [Chloroflexota bacterium]
MDAAEYINVMLRDLHGGIRADIEPLTQDQFVHQPAPGANTVAFLLWHAIRFEDLRIHALHDREPVWVSGHWADRLALDAEDLGTGFTEERMLAFRPAKEDVMAYAEAVWDATPALVTALSPERLDQPLDPERPRMTVGRSLANFAVGHAWLHLGEIRFAKGLMGMPFAR